MTSEEHIQRLEAELAELKQALSKPTEYKWKYPTELVFYVNANGVQEIHDTTRISDGAHMYAIAHGNYRNSKQVAEEALLLTQRVNRLHAMVEQLDGFDGNYYIYCNNKKWLYGSTAIGKYPEIILMTEDCAKQICIMLNNGTFELNPKD